MTELDPAAIAVNQARRRWRTAQRKVDAAKTALDQAIAERDATIRAAVEADAKPNYAAIGKRFDITANGVRHIVNEKNKEEST